MFKVTGVVKYLSPVETFGEGKESQRIIVETQDKYPNYFPISFYGDRMKAIEGVSVGDWVEVDTYPGGRLKKGDNTVAFAYLNGASCFVTSKGVPTSGQMQQSGSQTAAVNSQQSKENQIKNMFDVPF
jgi:hypothetical protein